MSGTILPNPMSAFASSNYALKLYTIDRSKYRELSKNFKTMAVDNMPQDLPKKVIICESAVTGTQITNLTIDTIPLVTQGTQATNLKLDINQPRGSDLIDRLYAVAKYCGWESPLEMHYLLEIRLLGLDEDNRNNASITTITMPIVFTSMNVNMSYSATVYSVEAVYVGTLTNEHSYSKIPEHMKISSGDTLSTFFTNLAEALNEREEKKVDNSNFKLPAFVHEFDIPEDGEFNFNDLRVGKPESIDTPKNDQTLYQYHADESEVSATVNSTIQAFVDSVLRYVPEIQEEVVDGEQFVTTFIIDPNISILKFDKLSGKETYHVRWYIRPVVRRKYVDNDTSKDALENKAMEQLETVKLYDYYHTGTNIEVKDIKFDINNLYHAKVTQYQNRHAKVNNQAQLTQTTQNYYDIFMSKGEYLPPEESDDDEIISSEEVEDDAGNVYLYAEDIDIDNSDFTFYEPKMGSNPSQNNYHIYSPTLNSALQYKEDLDFIRNAAKYSFQQCDMKIKGDPYWILPPSIPLFEESTGANKSNSRDYKKENVALIRFNYPRNEYYDEDNTTVDNELSMFTAFYYIKSVTSTFSNGKFEQQLQGIREHQVSLKRIKSFINEQGIS